jgi:hypothetical protein
MYLFIHYLCEVTESFVEVVGAVLLKLLTSHHVDHDFSKPKFLPDVVYFDVHKTK